MQDPGVQVRSPADRVCIVPLFTIIADHQDGASQFRQSESVYSALVNWADELETVPWEGFSEDQREEILKQIYQDAREDSLTVIEGCRNLWRQDYVVNPGERCLRLLIIQTVE